MEFEFWWLIALPVFFVLGWLAARIDIRHLISESRALPRSYFRGLNFLLNEEPDKAIEAFIEVVKVNPETIELHFALGSLFRRRGETDRAIRMHRNLLERSDLRAEQRLHALAELGQDYLKAGFLDRAEETYLRLMKTSLQAEALRNLLDIYQLEKDWAKAIATAEGLAKETGQSWAKEIANYHCELAAASVSRSDYETGERALEAALAVNPKCVRANLIAGDIALARGDPKEAIARWGRIETQDPAYLALAAQRMVSAFRSTDDPAALATLLRRYLAAYPSLDLLDVVFRSTLEIEGAQSAYALVRDELSRNPTLTGLDHLIEAQLASAPAERHDELKLVKNLVQAQVRRLARYRCENCGFRARQFYWHCPACGGWETYPPKRGEEFEA